MGLIVALSFVVAALQVVFPWIWQYVIDEMHGGAGPVRLQELAFWMALVGVIHFIVYNLIQGARTLMNSRLQWRARQRVFEHLTELDAQFYREWRTGDLVTRLAESPSHQFAIHGKTAHQVQSDVRKPVGAHATAAVNS